MLNINEHLLTVLIEECAEIQKRATKALRFGIDDHDPTFKDSKTERERLDDELHDLFAVIEMLADRGALMRGSRPSIPSLSSVVLDREKIRAKKDKVSRFFEYARERGCLEID